MEKLNKYQVHFICNLFAAQSEFRLDDFHFLSQADRSWNHFQRSLDVKDNHFKSIQQSPRRDDQ